MTRQCSLLCDPSQKLVYTVLSVFCYSVYHVYSVSKKTTRFVICVMLSYVYHFLFESFFTTGKEVKFSLLAGHMLMCNISRTTLSVFVL